MLVGQKKHTLFKQNTLAKVLPYFYIFIHYCKL